MEEERTLKRSTGVLRPEKEGGKCRQGAHGTVVLRCSVTLGLVDGGKLRIRGVGEVGSVVGFATAIRMSLVQRIAAVARQGRQVLRTRKQVKRRSKTQERDRIITRRPEVRLPYLSGQRDGAPEADHPWPLATPVFTPTPQSGQPTANHSI